MFVTTLRWAVALALGAAGTVALAQAPNPCGVTGGSAMVGNFYNANVPYSATVQTTFERKLADGNAIHGSAITHQARDSAGRTRTEFSSGCAIGSDGQPKQVVRVSVYDPATRTTLAWTVNDQSASANVVHVMHRPDPVPAAPSAPAVQRQPAAQVRQQSQSRGEGLGSRKIEGVTAQGSRSKRTIPAGQMGNDQPIEMVDEIWIAKDLGLMMLRINDDPLTGRTTTQVVELNQAEPDAALFAAPAGYKLEEVVTKSVSSAGSQ